MGAKFWLEKGKAPSVWWKQCYLLRLATTYYVDESPCAVSVFWNPVQAIGANIQNQLFVSQLHFSVNCLYGTAYMRAGA
jgi:hypothetical protein